MNLSYCLIASIFIAASIYTTLSAKVCTPCVQFEASLNAEQLSMYKKVMEERQRIYIMGLVLGILFAFLFLYFNRHSLNPLKHGCVFVAITMTTQFFFYMLSPKKYGMISILKDPEQYKKWHAVHRYMQTRYYLGALLGMAGYFLFSYNLCESKKNGSYIFYTMPIRLP